MKKSSIGVALVIALALVTLAGSSCKPSPGPTENLDHALEVERLKDGHTLITDQGFWDSLGSEIFEVDKDGKVVWHYADGLVFAHSAKRLGNGNTLIADTANDRVIEVTPEEEIIWNTDDLGGKTGELSDGSHLDHPNYAQELPNGNILISDRNNGRVIEIDRSGQIAWSYTETKHPYNPERLLNGNTMITDAEDKMVMEVNPEGEIIWSYGGEGVLNEPRDADRLEDGHTLITDSFDQKVIEVDEEGHIVWSFDQGLSMPYEADRLPNGNTLVSDSGHHRAIEVDTAGKIVWSFRSYREPSLPTALQNGDFEEVENGSPVGWTKLNLLAELPPGERGDFSLDSEVYYFGKQSVAIDYIGGEQIGWGQRLKVKEKRTYVLTCWIKTEGLTDGGAFLQGAGVDELGGWMMPLVQSKPRTGTSDWSEETIELHAPRDAKAMDIWLVFTGKGKVWFDDVTWTLLPI